MNRPVSERTSGAAVTDRIVRHTLTDRVLHWLMAACTLILLATSFLPILGWQFPWVTAHWVSGFVLIAAVLVHTVRALFWKDIGSMLIGSADLRDVQALARFNMRLSDTEPPRPGKYSLAQKLIHHAFTGVVLVALVTGAIMMAKIDTPWWDSNQYILSDATWGVIYVLHGLTALLLITMVMAHVYFALRPEKLLFTRSMILGWITRKEYRTYHDPERWQVK